MCDLIFRCFRRPRREGRSRRASTRGTSSSATTIATQGQGATTQGQVATTQGQGAVSPVQESHMQRSEGPELSSRAPLPRLTHPDDIPISSVPQFDSLKNTQGNTPQAHTTVLSFHTSPISPLSSPVTPQSIFSVGMMDEKDNNIHNGVIKVGDSLFRLVLEPRHIKRLKRHCMDASLKYLNVGSDQSRCIAQVVEVYSFTRSSNPPKKMVAKFITAFSAQEDVYPREFHCCERLRAIQCDNIAKITGQTFVSTIKHSDDKTPTTETTSPAEFTYQRETPTKFTVENPHGGIALCILTEYYTYGGRSINIQDFLTENPGHAVPLFNQVLNGVSKMHKDGIFHRDLKPENVVIKGPIPTAVIIDFSSMFDGERSKLLCGTRDFMSPEVSKRYTCEDEGYSCRGADYFALAVMGTAISMIKNVPKQHIKELNLICESLIKKYMEQEKHNSKYQYMHRRIIRQRAHNYNYSRKHTRTGGSLSNPLTSAYSDFIEAERKSPDDSRILIEEFSENLPHFQCSKSHFVENPDGRVSPRPPF